MFLYEDIDVETYKHDFLAKAVDHLLVDVREDDEYHSGHLPNAISIPLSVFEDRYHEIENTGKPIVLVCAGGGRSGMAAQFMAIKGYMNLYNIAGGTISWAARGNPLEF